MDMPSPYPSQEPLCLLQEGSKPAILENRLHTTWHRPTQAPVPLWNWLLWASINTLEYLQLKTKKEAVRATLVTGFNVYTAYYLFQHFKKKKKQEKNSRFSQRLPIPPFPLISKCCLLSWSWCLCGSSVLFSTFTVCVLWNFKSRLFLMCGF